MCPASARRARLPLRRPPTTSTARKVAVMSRTVLRARVLVSREWPWGFVFSLFFLN
jgi:hypothetical protein